MRLELGDFFKQVQSVKYLGCVVNESGKDDAHVESKDMRSRKISIGGNKSSLVSGVKGERKVVNKDRANEQFERDT